MADRRTKIVLDLDANPYVRGFAKATAATKAFTKELNTTNDQMTWMVQGLTALAPALVPIGATAVPAISALTVGLGAAAGAAGVAALAFQGVGEATGAANDYALEPTAKNLDKLREELSKLGPAGREFVVFLQDLKPRMQDFQDIAQAGLFPGLMDGIDALMTRAPELERIIGRFSTEMGDLARDAGKGLAADRFDEIFRYFEHDVAPVMGDLGRAFGNVSEAIGNTLIGLDPLTDQFSGGLLELSRDFAEWSRNLGNNAGFQDFVGYVERVGPKVVDTFGNLVVALADIVEAAAPIGEATLPVLNGLARVLSTIAESPAGPTLIFAASALSTLSRAIALTNLSGLTTGFKKARESSAAFAKTTNRVSAVVSKRGGLIGGLSALGFALLDVDDKAGLSNAAMGAMLGMVAGPWGAAIGGAVGLTFDFVQANDELEDAIGGVNRAMGKSDLNAFARQIKEGRKEVARARDDMTDWSKLGWDWINPTEIGNSIKEGVTNGVDEAEDYNERAAERMEFTFQRLYDEVQFPDGGGFKAYTMSLEDLETFARRARPALEEMGYSLADVRRIIRHGTEAEIRKLANGVRDYNTKADSVPARTYAVRKAIKQLDNPMISAADSAEDLKAALDGLLDPALNAEEAGIAYREGLMELRKEMAKTNGTLRRWTPAGEANRKMIVDQVKAVEELAVAQAAQDGNSKRAIKTLKGAREAIINAATSAGASRPAIENFLKKLNFVKGTWKAKLEAEGDKKTKTDLQDVADKATKWFKNPFQIKLETPGLNKTRDGLAYLMADVNAVPDKHDTKIGTPEMEKARRELGLLKGDVNDVPDNKDVKTSAPGADKARGQIQGLDRDINKLNGKKVGIELEAKARNVIEDIQNLFSNMFADGGVVEYFAGGGLRENHVAQIAPAGAMRMWAEPETGGEAYIPLAKSKRNRSRAIADETVDRLGGTVLWNKDGAVYVDAQTAVPVNPSAELAKIDTMFTDIATQFGLGLSKAANNLLSNITTGFSWPLPRQYQPSGSWGHYASGGSHPALDWPAPNGTPIYPVFPGRVMHTTSLGDSYGNYTEIAHGGGLSSLYAHQMAFRTKAGEMVTPGQTIGLVDSTGNSTGPHLHLELKRNGQSFDYTSMLSGGPMAVGFPAMYHGDHSGLDRASPATAQAYAHSILGRWGWSEFMWPYWLDLGNRESGWRWNADNPSSSAYGIPQALPGSKMSSHGADWAYNAGTQLDWMGDYMASVYGSPYKAIQFHNAHNWYRDGALLLDQLANGGIRLFDTGGMWRSGTFAANFSGGDEAVLNRNQTKLFKDLVDVLEGISRRNRQSGPKLVENPDVLRGGPRLVSPKTHAWLTRNRHGDDRIDTPDLTRRAEIALKRAERELKRAEKGIEARKQQVKDAEKRVDKAQDALDDAKGKKEKKEAQARLDAAEKQLKAAEKHQEASEKRHQRAEKDLEKAKEDLKESRQDQRILDRAVNKFDLKGGMDRSEVRAEFADLLKAVRETMGRDSKLYKALKDIAERGREVAKTLDEEREQRQKMADKLKALEQAASQYRSTVIGNFRNDPFTGGLDEFALQVRADRNDAKAMRRALNRARRRGLSGGLYKQLAASGNLELAQQFGRLGRGRIRYYENLFEQRQKRTAELGDRAADVVYGKRIDRQTRALERQNKHIERLRKRLEHIEDRVGNRVEAGARKGTRDGMEGRHRKLQGFVKEARS